MKKNMEFWEVRSYLLHKKEICPQKSTNLQTKWKTREVLFKESQFVFLKIFKRWCQGWEMGWDFLIIKSFEMVISVPKKITLKHS